MKLALELVAGSLELSHEFAYGAGKFRQFPRPKEEKRQKGYKKHF